MSAQLKAVTSKAMAAYTNTPKYTGENHLRRFASVMSEQNISNPVACGNPFSLPPRQALCKIFGRFYAETIHARRRLPHNAYFITNMPGGFWSRYEHSWE